MEEIVLSVYGLWCLTTLCTIFQIYRGVVSCIGVWNRGTRRKPPTWHWQILSHNVVSSTPRHQRDSTSHI